jgi:hypothetical protein
MIPILSFKNLNFLFSVKSVIFAPHYLFSIEKMNEMKYPRQKVDTQAND